MAKMTEITGKIHIDTSELDVAKEKVTQLVALLEEAKSLINDLTSSEFLDLDIKVKEA